MSGLPNERDLTYVVLSPVLSANLNNIQDAIVALDYLRAMSGDALLGGRAQVAENDTRPSTSHLFCVGAGAAPFPSGTARTITNLAGGIAQSLGGTIDGITPQTLVYYLDQDEMAVQFADNVSGLDRWDVVQVKLTRATIGAQRVTLTVQIKQGTPAASPVEPAIDSGFVRWCAAKVTNGIGSGLIDAFNIRDYRMPIGLGCVELRPKDMQFDPASVSWTTNWTGIAGHQIANVTGQATVPLYGYPSGLLYSGRIVAVQVLSQFAPASANLVISTIRADLQVGIPTWTLVEDVSASLKHATDSVWRLETVIPAFPLWTNGRPAGYATRPAIDSSACERAGLRIVPDVGNTNFQIGIRLVRFLVAGM